MKISNNYYIKNKPDPTYKIPVMKNLQTLYHFLLFTLPRYITKFASVSPKIMIISTIILYFNNFSVYRMVYYS